MAHPFATATASTKRSPALSGGKRGPAVTHLIGVACDPLLPVNAETAERAGLDTPHNVFETFVYSDADIEQGDSLTVAGIDYPIRAVERWPWADGYYLHIICELVK